MKKITTLFFFFFLVSCGVKQTTNLLASGEYDSAIDNAVNILRQVNFLIQNNGYGLSGKFCVDLFKVLTENTDIHKVRAFRFLQAKINSLFQTVASLMM